MSVLSHRPNQKIATVPVAQRKIATIEQLPSHLQRLLERYPSHVPTETAMEIKGCSRGKLYADAAEGRIVALKDGAKVIWDVASIAIDLANLPVANFSPAAAPRSKTDAAALPIEHPPPAAPSRRGPGRPRKPVQVPTTAAPAQHRTAVEAMPPEVCGTAERATAPRPIGASAPIAKPAAAGPKENAGEEKLIIGYANLADFLTEKGYPIKLSTLHKLAFTEKGPPFVGIGAPRCAAPPLQIQPPQRNWRWICPKCSS